jgi:murein DD-endopeptidase MepM/ murein hydrolase activator NlpD
MTGSAKRVGQSGGEYYPPERRHGAQARNFHAVGPAFDGILMRMKIGLARLCTAALLLGATGAPAGDLAWPIDCAVGVDCTIGYPDTDKDGRAFNCSRPGYTGHEGTDIGISRAKMDAGTSVHAAADGVVMWVFDGKFDGCPDVRSPDCAPPAGPLAPEMKSGHTVCTELGPYCREGRGRCFWCFAGGNVVVIRHEGVPGVFATRYDHFRRGSISVKPGERVRQGQVIGKVGSAGNSSGPHLHFEVWGKTWYDPVEPWAGDCGPNRGPSLWKNPAQPWRR